MYQALLRDSSFFRLLLRFDEDLAAQARAARCACGGVLHSARYQRKPRGGPEGLGREYGVRFSFCCATEGCRRRLTPPSLRFLGRKVFFGALVLLVPVLREGPTPERLERLREVFAVSRRTLLRWRCFWRETFAQSRFWLVAQGRFATPVRIEGLPGSLLEAFAGIVDSAEQVLTALRFLAPITTGAGLSGQAV